MTVLGPELQCIDRDYVLINGRKLLYLAGTDYHRLSSHPEVTQAATEAIERYGISPTGSRITTGNHPLYAQLEQAVSAFVGTEQTLVHPCGYLSNTILLQAVACDFDAFFIDKQAHGSLVDAARQQDQPLFQFEHRDVQSLVDQLKQNLKGKSRPLVLTDGVFAATGDMAPLQDYTEALAPYDGKLLIDDAHAIGVLGSTGKGSGESQGLKRGTFYQTGTLSKAFGAAGGITPGDSDLIETIHKSSRAFISSTGLALPLVAAAFTAVSHLSSHRHLITQLQERVLGLKKRLRVLGFSMPVTPVPILSVTFHDAEKNKALRTHLWDHGIYPPLISYPGSPPGGHFRFILTSSTTQAQEDLLFETLGAFL